MLELKVENAEKLLDELYEYTQKEYRGETLTEEQKARYIDIVSFCHDSDIEIDFAIEY